MLVARTVSALVLLGLLSACDGPPAPVPSSTNSPGAEAEEPADDSGERIAWHIEAHDSQVVPFAYGDYCGGDFPFTGGFALYSIGRPAAGENYPETIPLLVVDETDTDAPFWYLQWRTTDSVYTATAYAASGDFIFEFGADGEPTGGHGEGAYFQEWRADGDIITSTDSIVVTMTREGPEPADCLQQEKDGRYTYY